MILLKSYKGLKKPATSDESFEMKYPNPSISWAPHKVFNIEIQIYTFDGIY